MKDSIILIGGGGHCKSCIDVIESEGRFEIAGILDLPDRQGMDISGYRVIGTDDDIPKLAEKHKNFFITMGHIKSPGFRARMLAYLTDLGVNVPTIIASTAYVSKRAVIGRGTIVMHNCMVNTEAVVGENNILNTSSLIEHEVVIGNNCHISTKAILNGQVEVGSACFVGSGTVVGNNIRIADNVVIAAGSQVLKSIDNPGTYIGNPLRKIR